MIRYASPLAVRFVAATVLFASAASVTAQITLDGDFDHGSLDETNSFATGSFVTLAGRDNFNPGQWKWLYFSADGVEGVTPTFQIDDNFVTGGGNLNAHEMVYSYDQEQWFFFDNNNRSAAADTFTFSNNAAFTNNRVYVAYGLPYSVGRATSHTQQVAASPYVSPTASGDANLVVGQSPGGIDDIGRAIPQQDLYGYRITDPSVSGPKAKIVLAGGIHSNETLGNYTLEAMVDYLLGDTLEAALLRRRSEFYVYPMINPDGRLAGYNRSTVEDVNRDPNRSWDPPNYDGQTEIAAIGEAMIADTGGRTDFYIDFHSTVQKGPGHFSFLDLDRNFQFNPFWQRLLELEPTVTASDASLINDTSARFGLFELGASFTMTFETRFLAGENEDRFVDLGQNFGRAFADILATPLGDLDFDGTVGASDWLLLSQNAQTSTAGLSVIDAYAAGDLNQDGMNDVLDFALFKNAFQQANGIGSFALMLAAVPEPGSAVLAAPALLVCGRLRNIRRT
ncbi:MAG: M14 family zinc carboxypeptidase [Planctomycetota bacterium]